MPVTGHLGGAINLVFFAILIAGIFAWDRYQAGRLLNDWAYTEGCELIKTDFRFFQTGPFPPSGVGGRVVYRVKLSDREGKIREGWFRCGGLGSNHVEVRWD